MKMRYFFFLILLSLITYPDLNGKGYKGAEYRTIESYLYGRFEVRYKPAQREGVVSSFFTYHEIESSVEWNEIDIEFVGRYENLVQFNAITPGQKFHIRSQQLEFNPYSDFHDYAFEWTPDYLAWFVDGIEVFRQTGDHVSTIEFPQKIMMNIWNPVYTNWVGYFDAVYLPTVSIYDYVKYSSYTPGKGNNGTNNDFTIEWEDEFNSFDADRWQMATHTFGGNQADFDPENIVFEDGYLHLFLTNDVEKSGLDNTPPKIIWAMANYDSTLLLKLSEEVTVETAENVSNFILPGAAILSAQKFDNIYVKLETDNYNPYNINNLIYSGLADLSENANTTPTTVIQVDHVDSVKFPIKINIGGSANGEYLADQEWNSGTNYGYWMGNAYNYSKSIDIKNTEEDEVFRSDRRGIIAYKIKLPNDTYKVSLLFSDNTNNSAGEGVFNIYSEGNLLDNDVDIFSLAGKNAGIAVDAEITVSDGILDIYFEEVIDSAFINAIVVDKLITGIKNNKAEIQDDFELYQNYPNPFNGSTNIKYYVNKSDSYKIKIFDLLGSQILSEELGVKSKGLHQFNWNGRDEMNRSINSGVFVYQVISDNHIKNKKMIHLK